MWGPLVLAGDLGPEPERRQRQTEGESPARPAPPAPPKVPVLVAAERPRATRLQPVARAPGRFKSDGVGREPDAGGRVREGGVQPLFRLHPGTYSAYWGLFSPGGRGQQKDAYAAEGGAAGEPP